MHQVTWTKLFLIQLHFAKMFNSKFRQVVDVDLVGCNGWLTRSRGTQDGYLPANVPGGQGQVWCVPGATKHYTHSQYRVRNTDLVRDNFPLVVEITCSTLRYDK